MNHHGEEQFNSNENLLDNNHNQILIREEQQVEVDFNGGRKNQQHGRN
jgi:hypothetical protein